MKYVMPTTDSHEYIVLHQAVRRARGRAKDHSCAGCGRRAFDWAWRHGKDPSDTNNYDPLCRYCHHDRDRAEWLVEERRKERERIERTSAFKGWSPERREAQRKWMLAKWSDPKERAAQSERAKADKPWMGRRPKNGGGPR